MSLLLSIDVGIKNLAMCLMDQSNCKILQWDVSGVPPQHEDGLFVCMCEHLNNKPWVLEADTVLIEKQPDRNKGMVSVQHFLHAYFVIHKKKTIIYDARHKVPDVVGAGKKMYAKRKKVSIERVHEHLKTNEINANWLELFEKSKKKDDLADTFLQGRSYVERREVGSATGTKKKKISPRKPTTNQTETKYSKSNLLWFMKTMGIEKYKKDKRIMKDTKRYFKSAEEVMGML